MSKAKRYASKINSSKKIENNIHSGRRKENKKSGIPQCQKILLIIFIIIFIISGVILIRWYYNASKAEEKYEELSNEVTKIENGEETGIDFEKLKNINPDVVGWIKIDGTTIDYPIMKTTNNEYYLKKDIYNNYEQCGSIFLDYKNSPNFTDKNIVIYGHHIKKGIMFADLVKIYDGTLGNDVTVNIYTPEKTMKFKVFSSYETEPEDYSINTNIQENEYNEFTNTLKQRSKIGFNSEFNNSNQILTLSTCDSSGQKRILVHASLEEVK